MHSMAHRLLGGRGSLLTLLIVGCLSLCFQRATGIGDTLDVVTAEEGETVTLPLRFAGHINNLTWIKVTPPNDDDFIILTYYFETSTQTNSFKHTGQERVLPDGSLQVRDLRPNDTGLYGVVVQTEEVFLGGISKFLHWVWLKVWKHASVHIFPVVPGIIGKNAILPAPESADMEREVVWFRETELNFMQLIFECSVSGSQPLKSPQYTGREKCLPDGSLQIADMRPNDTGHYLIIASQENGQIITDIMQLRICEAPSPSSWPIMVGMACGVLLIAAFFVIWVILHYKRLVKKLKDEVVYDQLNMLQDPAMKNMNMKKGRVEQASEPDPEGQEQ